MDTLEAKVEKPLQISNQGIEQYMQVKSADAGLLHILPSPNATGLYAQMSAGVGESVKVAKVGGELGTAWGILLDDRGEQYGPPMSYENNVMGHRAQVF